MRRLYFFLGTLFLAFSLYYGVGKLFPTHLDKECAFCNEKIIDYQKFYEDDLVLGLYTHKPLVPCHCLIIPKRHVETFDELNDQEMLRIGQITQKVHKAATEIFSVSSYLLLQKNGAESGQSVPHVHMHYIARKLGSNPYTILWKFIKNQFQKPISSQEMKVITERMQQAMQAVE